MNQTNDDNGHEPKNRNKAVSCPNCKEIATCACQECASPMCDYCFKTIHNFEVLKFHSKLTLAEAKYFPLKCPNHNTPLNLRCEDCSKYVCKICVAEIQCKDHTLTPVKEEYNAQSLIQKLNNMLDGIKASKETVKNELENLCNHQAKNIKHLINDHFKNAHAILQQVETGLVNQLRDLHNKNKLYIQGMLDNINDNKDNINEMLQILSKTESRLPNSSTINIDKLIRDAENMANTPWLLTKETETYWNPEIKDEIFHADQLREICRKYRDITQNFKLVASDLPEANNPPITKFDPNGFIGSDESIPIYNPLPIVSLVDGSIHKVHVTHIENLSAIYVRPCQYDAFLSEMQKFFADSNPQMCPSHLIFKGNMYVVQNNDNKWWRVIITFFNNTECKVYYVDTGDVTTVKISRVHIVHQQYKNVPQMSLKCALMCKRQSRSSVKSTNKLISDVIASSPDTYAYIVNRSEVGCKIDLYTYPKTSYERPLSVTQVLIFNTDYKPIGKMVDVNIANMLGLKDEKVFHFHSDFLTADMPVKITNIMQGPTFYVRKTDTDIYETLTKDMNEYYNENQNREVIYFCQKGSQVACLSKDLEWNRATVIEAVDCNNIKVFMIDSGLTCYVSLKNICKLHKKFYNQNKLSLRCSLFENAQHGHNKYYYKLMTQCVNLNAVVTRASLKQSHLYKYWHIDLTCTLNGEEISLFQKVLDHLQSFNNVPETESQEEQIIDEPKKLEVSATSSELESDVIVISANNPSNIYISLLNDRNVHKQIIAKVNTFNVTSTPETHLEWNVFDKCVFKSTFHNNNWCRAEIKALNQEFAEAEVFLSDFCHTENVKIERLHKMPSEISKLRATTIKCHLSGIIPALGSTWPNVTCEFLQRTVRKNDKCVIISERPAEYGVEESLAIQLWKEIFILGGALEPTMKKKRKINDMIVEEGFAVRDQSIAVESTVATDDVKEEPASIAIEKSALPIVEDDSQKIITQWLPPIVPNEKEFTGAIYHIDDNFCFYVMMSKNWDVLKYVDSKNKEIFSGLSSSSEDKYWFVGQPCIAQWSGNDEFYRGVVEELIPDSTKVIVKFVDYGNTEECDILTLRKNIIHQDIPILAIPIKLSGIKPKNGEEKWDCSVVDLMHSYAVEKECFVSLKDVGDDGFIRAKLIVNNRDIVQYMISQNLADPEGN